MRQRRSLASLAVLVLAAARCASTSAPAATQAAPEPVTPADFVASMADVAAGRNEALAETGLVLKRIEFRLVVGTETKAGGSIEVLVLEAGASKTTETSFLQELTLEIPSSGRRSAAARPLVPGVREFVEAAMNTARDLARADVRGRPASASEIRGADGEDHPLPHSLRRHHGHDPGLGPAVSRGRGGADRRRREHRRS